MEEDEVPWSYEEIAKAHSTGIETLLDIDTGGGERLGSFDFLPRQTFATEGYEPNLPLATAALGKRGIEVVCSQDPAHVPFPDSFFDRILCRHGAYTESEVLRMLKRGGIFITQQVGSLNAVDLGQALGAASTTGEWCLVKAIENFERLGIKVSAARQHQGKYRFYDTGALVYYLRCIPWQVADFSVEKYLPRLEIIDGLIRSQGHVDFLSSRFLLVVQKPGD